MRWLSKISNLSKKFKTAPTVCKIFVKVFWDNEGALLVELLLKSTQNDKIQVLKRRYMDTLMNLQHANQNKRHGKLSHQILLLHDSTWCWSHSSITQRLAVVVVYLFASWSELASFSVFIYSLPCMSNLRVNIFVVMTNCRKLYFYICKIWRHRPTMQESKNWYIDIINALIWWAIT